MIDPGALEPEIAEADSDGSVMAGGGRVEPTRLSGARTREHEEITELTSRMPRLFSSETESMARRGEAR